MIKVNLLPSEPGKRTGGPAVRRIKLPSSGIVPAVALLVALYGASIFAGYKFYAMSTESKNSVHKADTDKKKKQDDVTKAKAEFEKNMSNMQLIEEKYQVAQALNPTNRIFWSEKLNMIAMARMDLAVYVTKLTLGEQVDELETEDSVRQREAWKKSKTHPPGQEQEPKPLKRPIINQTLTIDAIAYGTDAPQRLRQILAFQDNLTSMTWHRENGTTSSFTAGMKSDFAYLPHKLDQVGGVEVLRFGFVCKAEPQAQAQAVTQKAALASATGKPEAKKSSVSDKSAGGKKK